MLSSVVSGVALGSRSFLADADRIFKNLYGDVVPTLENAKKAGDYANLGSVVKADGSGRSDILKTMKNAGQRGRGGAGFNTGVKWSFMNTEDDKQRYLVINADEGEPGTAKDRFIMRNEPHKLIEGIIYSAYALGITKCYIYIRGEFVGEQRCMQTAIDEAYAAGLLGPNAKAPLDVFIHSGAGAYVCGEETALLNSIEGKPGKPRHKPPYPAVKGLFGMPTMVDNVETIAQVPAIVNRGLDWWTGLGPSGCHGTKLYTLSGAVNTPCTVEDVMGVPLGELIDVHGHGPVGGWENVQAVIPGGSSTAPLLPNVARDAPMDFDSLKEVGTELGTGGVIVIPKSVDMVDVVGRLARFYSHESCGQCQPCKLGTFQMASIISKVKSGTVTDMDLRRLEKLQNISGLTICALAGAACEPIKALLGPFRESLDARIAKEVEKKQKSGV